MLEGPPVEDSRHSVDERLVLVHGRFRLLVKARVASVQRLAAWAHRVDKGIVFLESLCDVHELRR